MVRLLRPKSNASARVQVKIIDGAEEGAALGGRSARRDFRMRMELSPISGGGSCGGGFVLEPGTLYAGRSRSN